MHDTVVVMKDGRKFCGPLYRFMPEDGYLTLVGADSEDKLMFEEMASAVTSGERISAYQIGDQDEIERARKYMRDGREYNWFEDKSVRTWEIVHGGRGEVE